MDSMEVNKIFAAILTAGLVFGLSGVIGRQIVKPERPHHSAIQIGEPAAAQATAAPAAAAPAAIEPITPLLASANVQNGEQVARRLCAACHTFNEGGRNGVGPNLAGVVGAPHGHVASFNYSPALKGKAGPWTYEDLNAWLANPRGYAPGNRMAFAGIAQTQQRADLIAYLRSISPNAPAP
jgi:cytochrome c